MILGHTAVTLVLSTYINYVFPGAVLNTLSPHKQATIFLTSSEKKHSYWYIHYHWQNIRNWHY